MDFATPTFQLVLEKQRREAEIARLHVNGAW